MSRHFLHNLYTTIIFLTVIVACTNNGANNKNLSSDKKNLSPEEEMKLLFKKMKPCVKEPNDSADYKHIKYDFYLSKSGQLCERKIEADGRDTVCNCNFTAFYDSMFVARYEDGGVKKFYKPLNLFVDINSYVQLDSTNYSKDKNRVFYYYDNSEGGYRVIVDKADPKTFKRLCEYRWGIDKNFVFYRTRVLRGLNPKKIKVLYLPDGDWAHYIKDDKRVYYETEIVKGADAKTFKVVDEKEWDAEDKNHKYENGVRQK
jgi:hypothetical protein